MAFSFGKIKNALKTRNNKVLALGLLALVNVFAVATASIAWFVTMTGDKTITAFSGDLNVSIDKITAYKYVYPFYPNSTEFINYTETPTLKSYVVLDSAISSSTNFTKGATLVTWAKNGSAIVTTGGVTWTDATSDPKGPRNIHAPTLLDGRYYLVGDTTFSGVSEDPWSTSTGVVFAETADVTDGGEHTPQVHPVVRNVTLFAGAKFTLFDKENRSVETDDLDCLTFDSVSASNGDARFSIARETIGGNEVGTSIQCLRSGIYDITYDTRGLSIIPSRSDDAIIGNNMLDPTQIMLDHMKSLSTDILTFSASNIQQQKTMVVFDVELTYKNANPVEAGLRVYRGSTSSIGSAEGRYECTGYKTGYLDAEHPNAMEASDFYAFYVMFSKTAFAAREAVDETPAKTATEVLWETMHQQTNAVDGEGQPLFSKFINGETFDKTIDCPMHLKDNDDSILVPAASNLETGTQYHCYVAVDYDYEHCQFFLDEDRLGKRYLLNRDFGFYFMGKQASKKTQAITAASHQVAVGDALTLSSDAEGAVSWSSSDASIATVNNGTVTGVSAGTVTIKARAEGYYEAAFQVTVTGA